ncbi:MAG TPA: NAD(P)H-binding protein, partial [Tahibacter sp.]|nr:NAD(P)H-binding protein [Tahibacter sp.]
MKIVVIGGTGRIGSKVVDRLRHQGHDVIAAAPSTGVDVLSGAGLDAAMAGTHVVVDLANSPSFEAEPALDFFTRAGRHVFAAETKAGVTHHVALCVVGTEKLQASGYFRAKLAQERLIRDSGVPYTIIHSTQFYEFLPGIVASAAHGDTVRLS